MSATSISQSGTVSLTFYNSVAGLYLKHILTVMSKTGSLPEPIPVNLIVLFWTVYLGTPESLLDPVHSYWEIRSSLFCTFYFRTLLSNDFIVLCCKRYPLCQYEDIVFFFLFNNKRIYNEVTASCSKRKLVFVLIRSNYLNNWEKFKKASQTRARVSGDS